MYDRDTIELALLALEEHEPGRAAELAGVACSGCPIAARSFGSRGLHSSPRCEAERGGPTEHAAQGGVGRPKKGQARTRLRCRTGESASWARDCARRPGGPPESTAFLRISRSFFMSTGGPGSRAPDKTLRGRVRELFEEGGRNWGYRTIAPAPRGAARVREGRAPADGRRGLGGPTGGGAGGGAPTRGRSRRPRRTWWPGDFSAAAPTSCGSPTSPSSRARRQGHLSAVVDCYDGRPAGWRIGPRPTACFANGSLLDAPRPGGRGRAPWCTATAGATWPGWIAICGEHGLARSMSARGAAPPDNAACEGFFKAQERVLPLPGLGGRLAEFSGGDAYLRYYCSGEDQALARVAEPGSTPQPGRRRKVQKTSAPPRSW